jgi:central kinetochore subunit Mis15/CHL4
MYTNSPPPPRQTPFFGVRETNFSKHIYIQSHPTLPLLLIRLLLTDGVPKEDLLSPRRTFLLAIPSSSPYIFHTPATDTLTDLIRQSLSQVFSTPRFPVVVQPVVPGLSAKSLGSMIQLCGGGRGTGALGAWRVYAKGWVDGSPLAPEKIKMETVPATDERGGREALARARFGLRPRMKNLLDASVGEEEEEEVVLPALERAEWKITHGYPDDVAFEPIVTMRLDGSNVFHGVYEGIVEGWIDGARVPSWLTGEEGRTEGQIQDGRVV